MAVAAVATAGAIVVPQFLGGSSTEAGWGAAQGLPANTFAYAGVDISDDQLEPVVETLLKFPSVTENLHLSTDGDIRQQIFEQIAGDDLAGCDLTWDADLAPWVGDQLAVAGVDLDGTPAPVIVVQSTDRDEAEGALGRLGECAGDEFAWNVSEDGWALIGPDQAQVDEIAQQTSEGSLSSDSDFETWTSEVGDPGLLTMYAAPEAGAIINTAMQEYGGMLGGMSEDYGSDYESAPGIIEQFCPGMADPEAMAEQQQAQLENFNGAAMTLRFADGGAELEAASDTGSELSLGTEAGSLVGSLPEDTAAAVGVSLEDGWADQALEGLGAVCGEGFDAEGMMSQLSSMTGLDLPDDLTTLTGDAMALSVGSEFSASGMASPTEIPAALKIQGDPEAIDGVVQKFRDMIAQNAGSDMGMLDSDTDGNTIAIGPNPDYRAAVLEDGGLSGDSTYQDVVKESDKAGAVIFVNFNQFDQITTMMGQDAEDFQVLDGLGMSAWADGTTAHTALRISTD